MEYCTTAFPDFTIFYPSKPPVCAKAEKSKNNKLNTSCICLSVIFYK